MNIQYILEIVQLMLAGGLITLILLQSKGTGLSATFGGAGFATSKRGVEKIVFYTTIALLAIISATSLVISLF